MSIAWINRIGTAVPPHDIHTAFVAAGRDLLADSRTQPLFDRMAALADIEHRYSIFAPALPGGTLELDSEGFYRRGAFCFATPPA